MQELHYITSNLLKIIGDESIISFDVAMFSFNDQLSAYYICDKFSSNTKHVSITTQKGNSKSTANYLTECAREKGVKSTSTAQLGRENDLNSYHPKILKVVTQSKNILAISSGNISVGKRNLDYTTFFVTQAQEQSPLIDWATCIIASLNSQKFNNTQSGVYEVKLACEELKMNLETEDVFILPSDSSDFLFKAAILGGDSDEVMIASQGFNSNRVFYILKQLLEKGKKVKILLDDDIYWSREGYETRGTLMNYSYEYSNYLVPLISLGAEVRYLITNHHSLPSNYFHGKAMIFNKKNIYNALLGSSNMTNAAFRTNVEVNFELNGLPAAQAEHWFSSLWDRAVEHDKMPAKHPND